MEGIALGKGIWSILETWKQSGLLSIFQPIALPPYVDDGGVVQQPVRIAVAIIGSPKTDAQ